MRGVPVSSANPCRVKVNLFSTTNILYKCACIWLEQHNKTYERVKF